MFRGVLALLERSLRVDARAWGPHTARFGLMATIYLAVCYANAMSWMYGAPGLTFFLSIAYLNVAFMTLLGIGFFSTAITEEKEEDTLGLMLMAGISPLGILIGKSVGRLVQAMLLIAVQYPFTLLAVTMGGVTSDQISSVYVAMFAYLFMLAGVGLLCSTLASHNRSASIWMTVILVTMFLVPGIYRIYTLGMAPTSLPFAWIGDSCILLQIETMLSTGFREAFFSPQVVFNGAMGGIGFVLSWVMFGLAIKEPTTEATTRGFVMRNRGPIQLFSPGRPKFNPFIWKDFHFVAGGFAGVAIRLIVYSLLYMAIFETRQQLTGSGSSANWTQFEWEQVAGIYLVLMCYAITFDASRLVARSLHEEVRGQTLATLLLLPESTGRILYSKTIGSLLNWLVGPACMFFVITKVEGGNFVTNSFLFENAELLFLFASHFMLVPHVTALAAMFVRWGALPIGIGIGIGAFFLTIMIVRFSRMFGVFAPSPGNPLFILIGFVLVGLCAACHVAVYLRAEVLARK